MKHLRYGLLLTVGMSLLVVGGLLTLAQEDHDDDKDPPCDIVTLTTHWAEHAVDLSSFAQTAQEDMDTALRELYITGIAYQALAMECGFDDVMAAEREHATQHGQEITEADHEDDVNATAFAMSIGDPENGLVRCNTLQPEVSFACATCHRVDSMERLVGPGLLNIGNPEHDPSAHSMEDMGMDMDMDMNMNNSDSHADETEDVHGSDMDEDHTDSVDDHGGSNEAASMDETIEYIQTSILNPNAFVVPGYPENLMPSTYGEILTEEEINDLVAYLITLR